MMTTPWPWDWYRRASCSHSALDRAYGIGESPTGWSPVTGSVWNGNRAAALDTCTIGSQPASAAVPSTLSAPAKLLASISAAELGSVPTTAAACTTASHPSIAAVTTWASAMSPSTVSSSETSTPTRAVTDSSLAGVRTRTRKA